jgi:hypothetical protein
MRFHGWLNTLAYVTSRIDEVAHDDAQYDVTRLCERFAQRRLADCMHHPHTHKKN